MHAHDKIVVLLLLVNVLSLGCLRQDLIVWVCVDYGTE